MAEAPGAVVGAKRRRITRACDRCHDGGLKCAPGPTPDACRSCLAYGTKCIYNRPVKRRGPAPRSQASDPARPSQLTRPLESSASMSSPGWEYHEVADHQTTLYLADVYYRVVYPILLYFHWPTFLADLRAQRYIHDRSFYALTMAACATASARIQANTPLPPSTPSIDPALIPPSRTFYKECLNAIPVLDVGRADFNLMRTEALLGMLSLQHNDPAGCHAHLHRYLAMATQTGFHDEANWPSNLTEIEVQERRRLFWQCYHFDIYLAVTFGSPMRQREAQCCVRYPAEVYSDQDIAESQILLPNNGSVSFIRGWNFVTDLYRILEHITEVLPTRQANQANPDRQLDDLVSSVCMNHNKPARQDVLAAMKRLFEELPTELKSARPMTGNIVQDRFGFQAANIIITMTTVKMITARSEDQSVVQWCAIAGELLDGLSTIPTIYIQATSNAMLHHVAGVGHLLGSVIRIPLSQWRYLQVRSAILALADLVSSLESVLNLAGDISSKLRKHVQRIDQYMADSTKSGGSNHVLHTALPSTLISNATAEAPVRENDKVGSQASDKEPGNFTVPRTAPLSLGLDPTGIQSPNSMPNVGTFDLQVDSQEALPTFQLPEEAYVGWPIGLDFARAFDHLDEVYGDSVLGGMGLDNDT